MLTYAIIAISDDADYLQQPLLWLVGYDNPKTSLRYDSSDIM